MSRPTRLQELHGYRYFGRPTVEGLRLDLRAALQLPHRLGTSTAEQRSACEKATSRVCLDAERRTHTYSLSRPDRASVSSRARYGSDLTCRIRRLRGMTRVTQTKVLAIPSSNRLGAVRLISFPLRIVHRRNRLACASDLSFPANKGSIHDARETAVPKRVRRAFSLAKSFP